MSARRVRWGVLRTLATAVRTAATPGGPGLGERLAALPRLVRAAARRECRGTSGRTLGFMGAAVLYVLSPLDLVPEGLFALAGFADDTLVVAWLAAALITATEDFLALERGAPGTPSPAASPPPPGTGTYGADGR
ncbi:MAG TPA: YkvA family protein, partial [Candidatus Lustribacter sp.]|nr:YkvA family protein [Candidatus Lustribacter sp.]